MKTDGYVRADLEKSVLDLQLAPSAQKHALAVLRYPTRLLLFTAAMLVALGIFDVCSGWDALLRVAKLG